MYMYFRILSQEIEVFTFSCFAMKVRLSYWKKKKKEETEFLKLSLLIYRRNSEVQNSKSFSLTEFFFISSSRTFETTRNASQGSDYVQLPEK